MWCPIHRRTTTFRIVAVDPNGIRDVTCLGLDLSFGLMEQARAWLLAQAKFLDYFPVSTDSVCLQVFEQTASASDELQQPAAGSVILLVCLEMLS